jgi:hypothetical protein
MEQSAGSAQPQNDRKHAGSGIRRSSCKFILFHIDSELLKRSKRWCLKITDEKEKIQDTNNQLGRDIWAPGFHSKKHDLVCDLGSSFCL